MWGSFSNSHWIHFRGIHCSLLHNWKLRLSSVAEVPLTDTANYRWHAKKTTMADFRYKSLKSWKIDNIDLTQQFGSSIFTDIRYQSIKITWLIATDFYRLTTPWHVHQKKNLTFSNISNPLFITLCRHKPCVTKRRATTAGKTRNTTDFHANSNPLEDISHPPCCDVTLLFRTFPKVEKL